MRQPPARFRRRSAASGRPSRQAPHPSLCAAILGSDRPSVVSAATGRAAGRKPRRVRERRGPWRRVPHRSGATFRLDRNQVAVVDDGLAAATRHAERAEGRNALMHVSPYATTHLMDRCLGNDRRRGANRASLPIAAVFSGLRLLGARPPQPSPLRGPNTGGGRGEGRRQIATPPPCLPRCAREEVRLQLSG